MTLVQGLTAELPPSFLFLVQVAVLASFHISVRKVWLACEILQVNLKEYQPIIIILIIAVSLIRYS